MSGLLNRNGIKIPNRNINLEITNLITPTTCAQIVIEIIKYLAYQKQQIPYNYDRLKYVVSKRRENQTKQEKARENWTSQKYFNLTSTALDNLETIFESIIIEFEKNDIPNEMCIVLGANIISAKEVYRILIPPSVNNHHHSNHNVDFQNVVRKILRTLIFSDDLQTIVCEPLSPMNMYVLLKQKQKSKIIPLNNSSSFFVTIDKLCISPRTCQTVINLDYKPLPSSCCREIKIFNDSLSNDLNSVYINVPKENDCDINQDDNLEFWLQAEKYVKGFKAHFINGQSVSDLWIK